MKAIVLAAGYATRLYPMTRDTPKALLEVGGEPLLSRLVRQLCRLPELSEIAIVSNAKFLPAFREWAAERRDPVPLRILDDRSTSEDNRLGATGDLAFALAALEPGDEDLVVCAGDNLLELDLTIPCEAFRASGDPTLVVRRLAPGEDASRYNEVEVGADGTVEAFREKPAKPTTGLAAIAVYFYPARVGELVRRYLAEGGDPDAPGHFVAWLVGETRVRSVPLAGRWFDIGDVSTLERARAFYDSG